MSAFPRPEVMSSTPREWSPAKAHGAGEMEGERGVGGHWARSGSPGGPGSHRMGRARGGQACRTGLGKERRRRSPFAKATGDGRPTDDTSAARYRSNNKVGGMAGPLRLRSPRLRSGQAGQDCRTGGRRRAPLSGTALVTGMAQTEDVCTSAKKDLRGVWRAGEKRKVERRKEVR